MEFALDPQVTAAQVGGAARSAESVAKESVLPFSKQEKVAEKEVERAAEQAKRQEISSQALSGAVDTINNYLKVSATDLRLQINEEAGNRTVVSVLDRNDGKVIRQYPSDETLELAKRITLQMNEFREALVRGGSMVSQGVFTNTVA